MKTDEKNKPKMEQNITAREQRTPTPTMRVAARRIAGAAALAVFVVLLICVLTEHTAGFDDPVREFFYGLRAEWLTEIAIAITMMADKRFIIGICILLLIIPHTRMRFGVPLSAGALSVTIVNSTIKHLVQRARPDVLHLVTEHGHSFPSGHSITSLFFYGLAIWLVWRHVKNPVVRRVLTILLAIPMLLIGPTRIYLGVHYPTDVLAAWCLAVVAIVLVIEIIEAIRKKAATRKLEEIDDERRTEETE